MSAPPLFHVREGDSRLVISVPHAGTFLPAEVAARLTQAGRAMADTDWHVDRLYAFAADLDVTMIVATHSRYVVDLNRSPDGERLYPGQAETGICATETFDGEPLSDSPPDEAERRRRVATYWAPYHSALAAALARVAGRHGGARLLDAHSIRSAVPRLFAGRLPDLNFGTNGGAACSPALAARVQAASADRGFSTILDGRFRGGHITRHYGRPDGGVDAIQLELAQSTYMDEVAAGPFDAVRSEPLVAVLRCVVAELLAD